MFFFFWKILFLYDVTLQMTQTNNDKILKSINLSFERIEKSKILKNENGNLKSEDLI